MSTTARPLARATLAAAALVLGTLVAGVGATPATAADATTAELPTAERGATGAKHDKAEHKAEQKAEKKAEKKAKKKARKVRRAKAATTKVAAAKKAGFAAAAADPRLGALPAELVAAVQGAASQGAGRVDGWLQVAAQAKRVTKVRRIKAVIAAQQPSDLLAVIALAHRAVTGQGDPGTLAGLLQDLVGADLVGTPLEPLTDLVDGLLDQVLTGTGGDVVVDGLLDGLVDVVDQVLGGLLGGLGGVVPTP